MSFDDSSHLIFCSKMDDWVADCLRRRAAGGLVVQGKDGSEHLLGEGNKREGNLLGEGNKREGRHFFGLCPVCLKIGEHNACSGFNLS